MLDQVSVFDVLAADDEEHRTASRKALALAKVRVDNNLGRFLRAAQSEEEFEERLALVLDDFTHLVANSSAEVGHEHPEHIAAALRDHYRVTSKIADAVDFAKTPEEDDDEEDGEDDNKPPWLKAKSHRTACGPCDEGECKDCSGGDCHCSKCHKESRWAPREGKLLTQEQRDSFRDRDSATPKAPRLAAPWDQGYEDIYNQQQGPPEEAPFPESPVGIGGFHGADEVPPGHPDAMDYQGDPYGGQPCPHSPNWTTCPHCNPEGQGGSAQDQSIYRDSPDVFPHGGYMSANNPSDQDDDSSHEVTCPECGGDGKTAGNSRCGKCKGKGRVPNFGDSMLDALSHWQVVAEDGNTDLGGPEPKMDKGKWTPTDPKKYEEDSKRWPNVEKDIIEPIKAVNDDELKEIGEKTTEHEELPSEKEDSGFQTGGEDYGPHTDTWHGKDGQEDPVTRKAESKADDAYSNPLQALLADQQGPSEEAILAAFSRLRG